MLISLAPTGVDPNNSSSSHMKEKLSERLTMLSILHWLGWWTNLIWKSIVFLMCTESCFRDLPAYLNSPCKHLRRLKNLHVLCSYNHINSFQFNIYKIMFLLFTYLSQLTDNWTVIVNLKHLYYIKGIGETNPKTITLRKKTNTQKKPPKNKTAGSAAFWTKIGHNALCVINNIAVIAFASIFQLCINSEVGAREHLDRCEHGMIQ